MATRLLLCEECGCTSDDQARDWAAFAGEDLQGVEPTCVAIFCPQCAAREFGFKPERAEDYI